MKLIDNVLFLEFTEMIEAGVPENTIKSANQRNSSSWHFIKHPDDKRRLLVGYEKLSDSYKRLVEERFGNPYEHVVRQPILDMVKHDPKAHEFFKQYRYDENKYLPIRTVHKCTREDAWLRMINGIQQDHTVIKKVLGLKNVPSFYEYCAAEIKIEIANGKSKTYPDTGLYQLSGDMPTSYQRLMTKAKNYNGNWESLIPTELGHKRNAKLGKTEEGFDPDLESKQIAVIRKLASMHNNFDAAQVNKFAKVIFEKQGWHTVSDTRVYQIMQTMRPTLTPGRRGRRTYNSDVAMQIKRTGPQYPTTYFTLDGWTVELWYQDKTGYTNRMVVVVVLDAFNKYPVGYAIGDRENAELIRQANRNAILHLNELFGSYHYPDQVQSDNYALKQLTPFYMAVAHLHTPAAVGNAKGKIIEPYFKYLNKNYCQSQRNWSGHNIDSKKTNQVNREFSDLIKTSFPDRAGVIRQIDNIIAAERRLKQEAYVQAFAAMPGDLKHTLEYMSMDWLMIFGKSIGDTNKITGQGIIKSIAGADYTYDSFDPAFRQNLHINWNIIADQEDLTKVLAISPDTKLRFVLEEKKVLPMDIRSTTVEHYDYMRQVRTFNKERQQEIIQTYADDAEIVGEIIRSTPLSVDDHHEATLKAMFVTNGQQKEALQDAKGLKKGQQAEQRRIETAEKHEANDWDQQQIAYLHSRTNFNQYLD